MTSRDWGQLAVREESPNPNIRQRPEDYPVDDTDSPISVVNFNGVGGSTVPYAAYFPRLHRSDFRTRTLNGVGEDWPIDYATLEPFFALNDRMMGVCTAAPAWPMQPPPRCWWPARGEATAQLASRLDFAGPAWRNCISVA